MHKLTAAILTAAVLAGCATPPNRIAAIETGRPCTDADRARLVELSKIQSKTASSDAAGVFLLGLPLGSMSGEDHEREIAELKGSCGA